MSLYLHTNVVTGMLGGGAAQTLAAAIDAGTAAVIEIYNGPVPANADAAESNTLLASLVCSPTAFSGYSDTGTAARATFGPITSDTSADATGTATHFRIKTQTGGAVIAQGEVGIAGSGKELIMQTVAFTAGSTVSISTAWIDLPKGP
ncbi:hypothetical protein [Mycolicibacterium fortuitum]|uniref:hypothetical protein n=1 Tax=Mycolicibacterium fortuitum TaxID=1766 RepID=UPI000A9109CF|nr:hypothetical protein [Mycolicibacterium fortuitum]